MTTWCVLVVACLGSCLASPAEVEKRSHGHPEYIMDCWDSATNHIMNPFCPPELTNCPDAPEIGNGTAMSPYNKTLNATVAYVCKRGFSLIGPEVSKCVRFENKTLGWTPAPVCSKTCPPPPSIPDGTHEVASSRIIPGTVVKYQCDKDYYFETALQSIVCSPDGHWTHLPVCVLGPCSAAPRVDNAITDGTKETMAGGYVDYQCKDGYELNGNSSVECLGNDTWAELPFCTPIPCKAAPRVDNGNNDGDKETVAGASVSYKCNDGYELHGNASVECLGNNKWGQLPTCVLIPCSAAPRVDNGNNDGDKETVAGASVNYKCNDGYELHGNASVECLGNNKWGQLPTCVLIPCSAPPRVDNGNNDGGSQTIAGASVSYKCNDGYELHGNASVECLGNNKWGQLPTCVLIPCSAAPRVDNGNNDGGSQTLAGASVSYKCNDGYELRGNASVECLGNNKWGQLPTCVLIPCSAPPRVDNGNNDGGSQTIAGASVSYKCNDGYELHGNASVECLGNNKWGQLPTCVLIPCSAPPRVDNGNNDGGSQTIAGASVSYKCNDGYELHGNASVECLGNNKWGQLPTCVLIPCSAAPRVDNGNNDGGSQTIAGASVSYKCNDGYELHGNASVECLGNNKWGQLPTCILFPCTFTPRVDNGNNNAGNETLAGNSVTYKCKDGYELKGNASVECLGNNQWAQLPTCEPITCTAPPAVPNGMIVSPGAQTTDTPITTTTEPPQPATDETVTGVTDSDITTTTAPPPVTYVTDAPTSGAPPTAAPGTTAAATDAPGSGAPPTAAPGTTAAATDAPGSGAPPTAAPGTTVAATDAPGSGAPPTAAPGTTAAATDAPGSGAPPTAAPGTTAAATDAPGSGAPPTAAPGTTAAATDAPASVVLTTVIPPLMVTTTAASAVHTNHGNGGNGGHGKGHTTPAPADTPVEDDVSYPLGTVLQYACKPGYGFKGVTTATCYNDGSANNWSIMPECIPDCGIPPRVDQATVSYQSTLAGSQAHYRCFNDSGLTLVGQSYIQCVEGQWTAAPFCQVDCGKPPSVDNATVQYNETLFGNRAQYTCDQFYKIWNADGSGNDVIQCQLSGSWSVEPACLPDCGHVPDIAHANVTRVVNVTETELYRVTCYEQFYLVGDEYVRCLEGLKPHWSVLPFCECIRKPVDIVFLVDGSGSVNEDGFNQTKAFVNDMVSRFPAESTRFGLLVFSTFANLEFHLGEFINDTAALVDQVNNATYPAGSTATYDALKFAREEMFQTKNGMRPGVGLVCVVVTDGQSGDFNETLRQAELLRAEGVTLYSVGVGDFTDKDELLGIASKPAYVFNVQNYDRIIEVAGPLANEACGAQVGDEPSDYDYEDYYSSDNDLAFL